MPGDEWLADVAGACRDEPLAKHSQFGVGGPADWFVAARDAHQLAQLAAQCRRAGLPLTMVGAGSNALILDGGIRGLVVRMNDRRTRVIDETRIELAAGCMMPRVALDCAKRGIAGLEFGIGVPGTLGASVYGNAGAFGTEIKDVLLDCSALTLEGRELVLDNASCGFSYRHSRFKDDLAGSVVLSARLSVRSEPAPQVQQRTREIQAQRKATQPIGVRSLGSVFKNPPGDTAGRLIEACGLKGARHGGAQISEKHANFIVNVEAATAADVLALVEQAQEAVKNSFGIDLEREIIVLGEPPSNAEARA
ncbi:MAG TPA: UDP-N-acetylmuramate dehydrogenase [Candidatus Dormibacteraeota bacterium]|nr:UDP-N-acetylmuramate dehydrogenase [Candidatus Dormibacteraeota bacterium]